jgi:hypothetical protein
LLFALTLALAQDPVAPTPVAARAWSVGTGAAIGAVSPGWLGYGPASFDFLSAELRLFAKNDRFSHDIQIHPGQTLVSGLVGFPTVPVSWFAHIRRPIRADLELALAPGATIAVGGGRGVGFVHLLAEGRVGVDWRVPNTALELGGYLRPSFGVFGVGAGPLAVGGGAVAEITLVIDGYRN